MNIREQRLDRCEHLAALVDRANRLFCDSTMANHYATLVCARLGSTGTVEVCNAGHNPPLPVRDGAAPSQAIVDACAADVARFRGRARRLDDSTVMVVRRSL